MKYAFIQSQQDQYAISRLCDLLEVSTSGYYDWQARSPSARELSNRRLDTKIQVIYSQHKGRYGSPRITEELQAQGETIGENRVANRMKVLQIQAKAGKKFKVTTDSEHDYPVAPNVLQQDFTATAPNQKWVSDITYVWTTEGWLYLAVVLDLYGRKIIGWAMHRRINQELVCDALLMALWRRGFPKGVIVHSDRGSQYCSKRYQKLIKDNKLICSMSGKGCCYDNAAMESFFHTLKVELVHGERYHSREQAKYSIFEYIEAYYNTIRRHSANGNISPVQYEAMANSL